MIFFACFFFAYHQCLNDDYHYASVLQCELAEFLFDIKKFQEKKSNKKKIGVKVTSLWIEQMFTTIYCSQQ